MAWRPPVGAMLLPMPIAPSKRPEEGQNLGLGRWWGSQGCALTTPTTARGGQRA